MSKGQVRALRCALALVAAEGASRFVLYLSRPLLDEEIRTTRDILHEQSERIRVLIEHDTTRLLTLDSVLGWRYRANHRDPQNRTNTAGVRSDREYSSTPKPGVIRVAAFGNSFVYCNEVRNEDSWPALIEGMFSTIEVLNYGVGGYGADQAYLRFLAEGSRLSPQVVIIGFVPDDLGRLVNVYRRFRSNREIPLVKPRYLLDGNGQLSLQAARVRAASDYLKYLENPRRVLELGVNDQWYEPGVYQDPLYDYSATVRLVTGLWIRLRRRYVEGDRLVREGVFNPASSAFRIQVMLFEQFAEAVRARGAHPLIVLFPDKDVVQAARRGRRTLLQSLVQVLRARGLDYLDLTAAFTDAQPQLDVSQWFMPGGHYSPLGNRLVAGWLGDRLLSRGGVGRARHQVGRSAQPSRGSSAPVCTWPRALCGRSRSRNPRGDELVRGSGGGDGVLPVAAQSKAVERR